MFAARRRGAITKGEVMHRHMSAIASGFVSFGVLMVVVTVVGFTGIEMTWRTALSLAIGGLGIGFALDALGRTMAERRYVRIVADVRRRRAEIEDPAETSVEIKRPIYAPAPRQPDEVAA